MYADAIFQIGATHRVCQDYAAAGVFLEDPTVPFALASDGCSGSQHTDFGSRFLVRAAHQCLSERGVLNPTRVLWTAAGFARQLQLDERSLDASLIGLFPVLETGPFGGLRAFIVADGVVAGRDRQSGKVRFWDVRTTPIKLPSGLEGEVPAYLSYMLDRQRCRDWVGAGGGHRTVHTFFDGVECQEPRELQIVPEDPDSFVETLTLDPTHYDLVAVFTDGVRTFNYRDDLGNPVVVPVNEVLSILMSLKGRGALARGLNLLNRHAHKQGWTHDDDLGGVNVYVPESGLEMWR